MARERLKRVNELLRREIGEALFHVVNEEGFDMSSVMVSHVVASANLRQARVLVSIRDHREDRGRMLALLRRKAREIQRLINRHLKLKYTPRLLFELDSSVEQGDHILQVLSEMEIPPDPGEGETYGPGDA
jgi:ribosome-binding factor A